MSSVTSSSAQNHAHCCRMYGTAQTAHRAQNLFTSVQQHTGQGGRAMVKEGRKEKERGEREGKERERGREIREI